jgi:hypothetical protein
MRLRRFAPLDFLILIALLGGGVYFAPYMRSHEPDTVVVYRDNAVAACYPLSENRLFTIKGARGPMVIRVHDKTAAVESSTCPERMCVQTRPIAMTSQQIICEPNHIILEISPSKDTLDAVSR